MRRSISSTSAAVGQRRLRARARRGERAGGAGAGERLLARAALEQRDEQAGGERVAGGRAVDGLHRRRRGAGDLLPALEQDGALGAERQRRQAVVAADRLELVAVDDEQVDLGEEIGGSGFAGAAFRQKKRACRAAATTVSTGISSWQSTASASPSPSPASSRRVRARRDHDLVLAVGVDEDQGDAGRRRRSAGRRRGRRRPRASSASASSANGRRRRRRSSRTSAPSRAAASAWFAPLPPGTRSKVAPVSVSPGRGSRSQRATRSRLIDPTTAILGAHDRGVYAAIARRSSSVRPSRFSRRSNRPAQSDERSGSEPMSAAARRPSSARTSTASSR